MCAHAYAYAYAHSIQTASNLCVFDDFIVVDFCESIFRTILNGTRLELSLFAQLKYAIQFNPKSVFRFISIYFIHFRCKEDEVHLVIGYLNSVYVCV